MTSQEARQLARDLFLKTLPHLDVGTKMRAMARLRDGVLEIGSARIPLHSGRPVRVIAMGKAAIEMAHALAEIMEGVPLRGVVAAPALPTKPVPGFEYFAGGHPYPNEQSFAAAVAMLSLLRTHGRGPDSLVIFLISGGGSSLAELPMDPTYSVDNWKTFYAGLVTCGASIQEINTVRKHFSAIKGGRLARAAEPAEQVTIFVSDVPEMMSSVVASGPSMPDESTLDECEAVLSRYVQFKNYPMIFLPRGPHKNEPIVPLRETPKDGLSCFARSSYYCLLSNWDALNLLANLLYENEIIVRTVTSCDDWEFEKASDYLLTRLSELRSTHPGQPVAVVSGGELSCPVTGDGMGGRNQAFVLDCAQKIAGYDIVVLSAGTDGIDGNSPAAGAIADGETIKRAKTLGMHAARFQEECDSFHFFEKLGDTIITGPTGTNVRDLRLLLAY